MVTRELGWKASTTTVLTRWNICPAGQLLLITIFHTLLIVYHFSPLLPPRVLPQKQYYTSLTGLEFANEVLCSRNSHHCTTRRLAEGTNHTHPVVICTPPSDLSLYDPLIQVNAADAFADGTFQFSCWKQN